MHMMKGYMNSMKNSACNCFSREPSVYSRRFSFGLGALAILVGTFAFLKRRESSQNEPAIRADGGPKQTSTMMLEMGSKLLQSRAPTGTDVYFVGFHPMHDDPCHQMEAHHYCKNVNEDFAQCLLYDGNTKNANLTGLEYIISEKLFHSLPEEEAKYWHPHNYEIISGQMVLPGIPGPVEKQVMKKMMNSYGKTYHTWRAKCFQGDKPFVDTLPKGPAVLAWSFNHDGEIKPEIVQQNEKFLAVDRMKKRKEREDLVSMANPQRGVNELKFTPTPKSTSATPTRS